MRPALVLLALLLVAPAALAQNATPPAAAASPPPGVSFVAGGAPGIHAAIDGVDLTAAAHPRDAFDVDPGRAVNLTLTLAPPPNVTWQIRSITVGVVISGPGSEPPSTLTHDQAFNATLPPGYTVFVNRTIQLAQLKHVGTGLFLMRVDVADISNAKLYSQEFYVHVEGNVILTASGAAVTVASVATGYGLWQILRDVREMYKARERHRKREREKTKAETFAAHAIGLTAGLEGIVDVGGDVDPIADRLSKRGPLAWSATGLGLGGVTMSWLQFLGYVPFNLAQTAGTALGVAAAFLTVVLLVIAITKRVRKRRGLRVPVEEMRSVPVQEGSAPEASEEVEERHDG